MLITIDTSQPLSDLDRQVLEAYLSDTWPPSQPTAPAEEPVKEEPKKPAPRKRAAKPAPEKEPEPEPEPEDEASDGPTLDDAVKAVRDAVSAGKKDDVKAALAEVGVKRASEMETTEQIAKFLEALNG